MPRRRKDKGTQAEYAVKLVAHPTSGLEAEYDDANVRPAVPVRCAQPVKASCIPPVGVLDFGSSLSTRIHNTSTIMLAAATRMNGAAGP